MQFLFLLAPWLGLALTQNIIDNPSVACTSNFFCDGEILKTIQLSKHVLDNKYFVDMATTRSEEEIIKAFNELSKEPSEQEFSNFMNTNFYIPGIELDQVKIPNYPKLPLNFKQLKNPNMIKFAEGIHQHWGTLVRKYNPNNICKECKSSLLPIQHPFVIPGGRFREFYYWDSFFVMIGLHHSNLESISKDMLKNFGDFVETYGLIPNGARRYFLNRSQPPLYIPAMDKYLEKSKDFEFLKFSIKTLEKEYDYWINKHTINVDCPKGYSDCGLTRFIVDTDKPRPESYREDLEIVEGHDVHFDLKTRNQLYADIAAGAETGWDFSTRWIPDAVKRLNKTVNHMLRGIQTSAIIPVDLNSIMYKNEMTLSKFHVLLAEQTIMSCSNRNNSINQKEYHLSKAKFYQLAATKRAAIMYKIMWNPVDFNFYDFNILKNQQTRQFTLSNYWPFWADSLTPEFRAQPKNYLNSFNNLDKIIKTTPGGSPTTLLTSGLQWDFPNSWAPLEYILVEGLRKSALQLRNPNKCSSNHLDKLAHAIAEKFVQTTYCAWSQTQLLYEKYEVKEIGKVGGGGEYNVQSGFGWTNAVVLHFLSLYPDLQPTTKTCSTVKVDSPKKGLYGKNVK